MPKGIYKRNGHKKAKGLKAMKPLTGEDALYTRIVIARQTLVLWAQGRTAASLMEIAGKIIELDSLLQQKGL